MHACAVTVRARCARSYNYSGSISIDGVDINSVALGQVRRDMVCAILQDSQLLSGTIRTNLVGQQVGANLIPSNGAAPAGERGPQHPVPSDAQLWDVIRSVGLQTIVEQLPLVRSPAASAAFCVCYAHTLVRVLPRRNWTRRLKRAARTFLQARSSFSRSLVP